MTNFKYDKGIFIGRVQPFHKAHEQCIKELLKNSDKIIILIGSHKRAPSIRNPWNSEQRISMIKSCFSEEENSRISFFVIRDYLYNDNLWLAEIKNKLSSILKEEDKVCLVGHDKDHTTYYLNLFSDWSFIDSENFISEPINATDIRNSYFTGEHKYESWLPKSVIDYLDRYKTTLAYSYMCEYYSNIQNYKKDMCFKNSNHTPTFNTGDVVLEQNNHFLLIKRRFHPGKDLYAFPGGFLNPSDHSLQDCALRELKEETNISLTKKELESFIVNHHLFDAQLRSERGRVITYALHIKIPNDLKINIKAGDDAIEFEWWSLNDCFEKQDQLFDDHFDIIHFFSTN